MKIKIYFFMVFIISLFFLSMPKSVFAACCEYEKGNSIECVIVPEGAGELECKGFAELMSGVKNPNARYYARKTCEKPLELGQRCICPKDKTCLELQVPFPGSQAIEDAAQNLSGQQGILAKYIVTIFQFLVWAAISLAIFMIMVAGFIWLISAGNQGMIGKAKGYITNALYGLIIALTSYIILQTINPKLVELKMPAINAVEKVTAPGDQCCYETTSKVIKDKIELFKGQTCQSAFGALGGTWEKCTEKIKNFKSCCLKSPASVGWRGDLNLKMPVCYLNMSREECNPGLHENEFNEFFDSIEECIFRCGIEKFL